ncbi:MAG: fibronectin type III-like domain-contianing protein [Blautia marasmi]
MQLYVADKTGCEQTGERIENFPKWSWNRARKRQLMELDKRSFAWYNTEISDWYAATGTYEILVGSSSRDIYLRDAVQLVSQQKFRNDHMNTTVAELLAEPKAKEIMSGLLKTMMENIGAGDDGKVQPVTISPEMSLKMMENYRLGHSEVCEVSTGSTGLSKTPGSSGWK